MGLLGDVIDGFLEGAADNNSASLAAPQHDIVPVNSTNGGTISSFQEMTRWLNTLQKGASPAVKEALSAQINVIRFVQSPTLVDTTFDTLMYSLDKSLSIASSPQEKTDIRELFCLMIQNYAFFMDAKYQMEVNKNREEGRQLFIEAGEMLSNSIKDVALMAVGGADVSAIANTTITNLFAPENGTSGITGFLNRLFNHITREEKLEEEEELFYSTVESIITKLGEPETQRLLGKSNLLAGTIKRYVPIISDYRMPNDLSLSLARANLDEFSKIFSVCASIWLGGSFLWALIRWIHYSLSHVPHGWFGRQMLWTFGVFAVLYLLLYLFSLGDRLVIKKREKELTEYFNNLFAISESYKEPFESQYRKTIDNETDVSKRDIEQEYLDEVKAMLEDGEIGPRERKSLERARIRLCISEERATEIEAAISTPKLTDEEKEYLDEVKAMLEDGEIGPRERKSLERARIRLGISEERAKEIELIK